MNENDKILINSYFDGELSDDEIKYVENLISSNEEANDYANNIKRANAEIDTLFNSSEFIDFKSNLDKFIEKQNLNSKKPLFDFSSFLRNPKYYGFAASVFILVIILVPTFNEERFDDLPVYSISSERDSKNYVDFEKVFNDAVTYFGSKSIWAFKIESDESTLIVEISDWENDCYVGTVTRANTSDIKEFQVCKE
jgi:hypothetical protein